MMKRQRGRHEAGAVDLDPARVPAPAAAAIDVRSLVVRRGAREVLHGLDLQVPVGQVVGLLGPSGGGKSTLMRAIVGVQVTHGGEVLVLGRPAGSAELRREVGYTTQSPSVYDDLSVAANVTYHARLLGVRDVRGEVARVLELVDLTSHADDLTRALSGGQRSRASLACSLVGSPRLLELVALTSHADDLTRALSGGQRSRASLACSLVGSPRLLVLDEPTVGLDPVLRRSLWDLFHRLADGGTTLLVSSHVMDEAARCDRLVLVRDGRVLADSTLAELLAATGTTDAEQAFLTLIDRSDAGAADGDPR